MEKLSFAYSFYNRKYGILDIEFEYVGATTSIMRIMQKINNHTETVNYQYASDIFIKYLIRFLEAHLAQWNTDHIFNNDDIVIDFYNEVLEAGVIETPFNISL